MQKFRGQGQKIEETLHFAYSTLLTVHARNPGPRRFTAPDLRAEITAGSTRLIYLVLI